MATETSQTPPFASRGEGMPSAAQSDPPGTTTETTPGKETHASSARFRTLSMLRSLMNPPNPKSMSWRELVCVEETERKVNAVAGG
jgi:hypothetical protein